MPALDRFAARRRAARHALLLALAAGVPLAPLPLAAQARVDETVKRKVDTKVNAKVKTRVDVRVDDHGSHGPADTVSRIDTTMALDARGVVELSLLNGTITVKAWDRNEVRIKAEAEGGGLDLDAGSSRVALEWRPTGHGRRPSNSATYEVTMPATARLEVSGTNVETIDVRGVRGGMSLESMNGDLVLADVGGTVEAELMNGEISVRGADGDLRLSMTSGDVSLTDVAGRVEVETVSGDVSVTGARVRELRIETTSGTLTYEGSVSADGRYELVTHSGDVVLRIPDGTKARLSAETYNGEFRSDFPVTMQPGVLRGGKQRQYELLIGDGSGPLIRAESFSGDIHLGRAGARPD